MNTNLNEVIAQITNLERNYLDYNETVQKIDKRIWSIAARFVGIEDNGTYNKVAVGKLQKALIAGKCDLPLAVMATTAMVEARNTLSVRQDEIAKEMAALAQELPLYEWFTAHRGLKDVMFARLIAKSGTDLNNFDTPAKFWSWFGLGVEDGKSIRPKAGQKLPFDPRRRAFAIGVIGTNLMMQNPEWKGVYDRRKQYERDRAVSNGLTVKASSAITEKQKATGKFMSDGHVHARARRYMVKKFLETFWQEWTENRRDMNLPEFITK